MFCLGAADSTWLHVALKSPETVTKYAIVSGNDAPARDPSRFNTHHPISCDWAGDDPAGSVVTAKRKNTINPKER